VEVPREVDEKKDGRVIMDGVAISSVHHLPSHGAAPRVQGAWVALASASDAVAVDAYSVSTLDPAATHASYVALARVRY